MISKRQLKKAWDEYKDTLSSGSSRQEADRLYREKVWPLLLSKWRESPEIKGFDKTGDFAVSIHTLGSSPEALILAALALGANHVVVLHTEKTKEHLPLIEKDLGVRIEAHEVDKGNPVQIYKIARQILDRAPKGPIAFDITSGTKAMTAGLASAGFFIQAKAQEFKIDVFYVDNSEYDSALRRPVPGSEFLVRLPSPYVVFGELQEERGLVLYSNGAFRDAEVVFRKLSREHRSGKYQNLAELAHVYARWSSLDFKDALGVLDKLLDYLQSDAAYDEPLKSALDQLKKQQGGLMVMVELISACEGAKRYQPQCLDRLADVNSIAWLAQTLLREGGRYESQENYVLSALHYYRALELLLQHRLALRKINPHSFNTDALDGNESSIMESELQRIFGSEAYMPLAGKGLTLLNMAVLLTALKDQAVRHLGDLRQLHGLLDARNESILIHGLSPASENNAKKLREVVEKAIGASLPKMPIEEVKLPL